MGLIEHGFLGSSGDDFLEENKTTFHKFFLFADVLNTKAHTLLRAVSDRITSRQQDLVIITLYLRIISSFASAVKLMGYGLEADAGTITRTIFESTIYIKKCSVDPQWTATTYVGQDLFEQKKFLNANLQHHDHVASLTKMKTRLEKINRQIIEMKFSKVNLADLASDPDVGMARLYDTIYRILSNGNVHSSTRSLEKHMNVSSSGEILRVIYDNSTAEIPRLMSIACFGVLSGIDAVCLTFKTELDGRNALEEEMMGLFIPDSMDTVF